MLKNILKVNGLMFLMIVGMMTSCTKEVEDVTPESFGATESFEMRKGLNAGRGGCLEVIFPLDITLPDGTIIEVSSFLDAKEQFKSWKEANPDVDGRPHVVYPIEVITRDGETVSINERSEIKALLKDCRSNFGDKPRDHKPCFHLVFPVSISFPNGTIKEFATRKDLKKALRIWRKINHHVDVRPALVFPLDIVFEDETTQTINSKEELALAKENCD